MNESYSNALKNNYLSLDKLNNMVHDMDELEDEVFSSLDNLKLSPSQDTLNKILSYLKLF
ncbi:MAG: hypothetical protein IKQ46_07190 [Bacteroidales bacterium]|nr:hypothetical protein [Bacteroidales bacterium]